MNGRIFSIEEFATFDGPGIRTTVFLKGCPLSCTWCHNPEGQSFAVEYMRSPNGCLHCGACRNAGENGALSAASVCACPRNLVRAVGEDYAAEALVARLLKNAPILRESGGGVTFSGGEPLAQGEFLLECLSLLRGKMHRAVQTTGFARRKLFTEVLSDVDYVLVDNGQILENYARLAESGKPFVTRVPLIPGVIDTVENLTAIADILKENGVSYVELLPYNRAAPSKYQNLLRAYEPQFDDKVPSSPRKEIFENAGITAKIM